MSSNSGASQRKPHGRLAELTDRLEPLVSEAVEATGYELENLEVAQVGRKRQVKAIVDGENGVELDEVARISRKLSEVLDEQEHLLEGSYTLEVTSPGLDRPLTKPRHWRRARTRLAKVTLTDGTAATVRVGDADEHGVRLLFNGRDASTVDYQRIERAVIEVEFRKPPAAELELLGLSDQEGSK